MKSSIAIALVLGIGVLAGCASDADVICDKADECNLLQAMSVEECVEQVEKVATESQRETCADCAKDKACSTLVAGACAPECFFLP